MRLLATLREKKIRSIPTEVRCQHRKMKGKEVYQIDRTDVSSFESGRSPASNISSSKVHHSRLHICALACKEQTEVFIRNFKQKIFLETHERTTSLLGCARNYQTITAEGRAKRKNSLMLEKMSFKQMIRVFSQDEENPIYSARKITFNQ